MTPLKLRATHRLAAVAAPLLLALSLSACGGDDDGGDGGSADDAPDSASVEDFCDTFLASSEVTDGAGIKDFADALAEVGTPDDMSDEEREGFEVFVAVAQDVDEGATLEDLDDPDVSADEEAAVTAFIGYATTNCADQLLGDVPTDAPS